MLDRDQSNVSSYYSPNAKKVLKASCMYAKKVSRGNENDNAAACLYFVYYLAFPRPAADRTDSTLP